MFNKPESSILVLLIVFVTMLVVFGVFIVTIIYRYQKKQIAYFKEFEELKVKHHNTLLQSQLEVQEQTFQHIAREIHDNIGQKLTLAKLYLNTLSFVDMETVRSSVLDSLCLITESICSLSDISRSMGTEVLLNNGLVKGIELELEKLDKTGLYKCDFSISGTEVFLNANAEILIFRIMQECLNNFVKHATGEAISVHLVYLDSHLELIIKDNGKGFDTERRSEGSGLLNMKKRATMLNGTFIIESSNKGSVITIKIPINENTKQANAHTGG